MIRVVLADDQDIIRVGLRVLVENEDDLEVVGEAADGQQTVDVVRATVPDVLLLDVRMPGRDGLSALREITADPALTAVRVIVLTTFQQREYVFEALRHGASGFLIKDTKPAELLRAIRVAVEGDSLMSPSVTRQVIDEFAGQPQWQPRRHPQLDTLTDREREVMSLVAAGLTNDEIAGRLFLSPATVRTHVGRAMGKLNARDRAQLVVFAYQSGLIAPS